MILAPPFGRRPRAAAPPAPLPLATPLVMQAVMIELELKLIR